MKISLTVISGSLKSRKVQITKNTDLRPMLTRARSTIFNILFNLIDLEDIVVLDVCAGSGILGIETLSRNAQKVHFFDISKTACKELDLNLQNLNLREKSQIYQINIFHILENKYNPADLIFLDLPYKSSFLIPKILNKLEEKNWINDETLLVIATDKKDKSVAINIIKETIVSNTKILFGKILKNIKD